MRSFLARLFARFDTRLQLIIIAAVVGIFGGAAAVLLNLAIHNAGHWLRPLRNEWFAVFFPAIGIMAAIVIFRYVFKDQGAHGVPEVIYAVSKRGGLLRLRASVSRLLACLVTIAGGGSAGPEAPVVMSGASIGSNIAGLFHLKDRQRIVIVGCGASAAIAAIFNAPATGIVFTMEAVLGEWTQVNLIPIAIASVVGTEVSRTLRGNQIPFDHRAFNPGHLDLIACIGLSIFVAFTSVLFVRVFRIVAHGMENKLKSIWTRALLGGILVGVIGVFFPDALGEGYRGIQNILNGTHDTRLLLVGACIIAKIIATSLTAGAGGVGGVFAPCLVVGAMSGLFYREGLIAIFPDAHLASEGFYGLLGMAGVVSSVLQAPLTGIFLIMEITGGYDVLLSVVLVSVLSASLGSFFEPHSLYHRNLLRRGLLLRSRTDARVLAEIQVIELLEKDCLRISPEMTLGEFVTLLQQSRRNYFAVEDPETKHYLGLINLDNVKPYLFNQHLYNSLLVEEFMEDNIPMAHPEDHLSDIIGIMDRSNSFSLPVVENNHFLGLVSKATLLDHYRREMVAQEENY